MVAADVALLCKALGDTNRLQIVQMLSDGENAAASFWNSSSLPSPPSPIT